MAAKEHVNGLPSPSSRKMISWPPARKLTLPKQASRPSGAGASALRQAETVPERTGDDLPPTLLNHRLPPRLRTPFERFPPVSSDMAIVNAGMPRRLRGVIAVLAVMVIALLVGLMMVV